NEALAKQRFQEARKLASTYLFEIHDAIQDLPGSTPARALVVRRALDYLDSLSKEAGSDRSLQRDLAEAYRKVGDVQGAVGRGNLGDSAGARRSYEKSLKICEELVASGRTEAEDQRQLVLTLLEVSSSQLRDGEFDCAEPNAYRAVLEGD